MQMSSEMEKLAATVPSNEVIKLTPDSLKALIEGVVKTAIQEAKTPHIVDLSPEEKEKLEQSMKTEWQRQRAEPHHWIEFQMLEDDKDTMVFAGVNGVSYWYKKNMKVPVPDCVLKIFDSAKVISWKAEVDDISGQMVKKPYSFLRFPYQYLGPASADEVEAWKKDNSRQLK
jgi:hypothetical protein